MCIGEIGQRRYLALQVFYLDTKHAMEGLGKRLKVQSLERSHAKAEQQQNNNVEITRLKTVRGELADIAIERDISGEAKQSFNSTIDWLSSFINE